MAEVAALSLAANVLQMLDYGRQFVGAAWSIYNSRDGVTSFVQASQNLGAAFDSRNDIQAIESIASLRIVSQNLTSILQTLETVPADPVPGENNEMHYEISLLVEEGRNVSVQILEVLKKAGFHGDGKRSKFGVFKSAFFAVFKSDQIKTMETKLDRIQSRLTLNLVVSIRQYTMFTLEKQGRILQKLADNSQNTVGEQSTGSMTTSTSTTAAVGNRAIKYLSNQTTSSPDLIKSITTEMFSIIFAKDAEHQTSTHAPLDSSKYKLSDQKRHILYQRFLSKLHYEDMYHREDTVVAAHDKTFHWIFERNTTQSLPWADFCQFLESETQQRYWITGKPGSGKSTLMKFITRPLSAQATQGKTPGPQANSQLHCTPYLQTWAGGRPLSVGSFYFWAVGSQMQTSREGLFRTILHQLLTRNTEVIPKVSPARWESLCLFDHDPTPFTEEDLRELLSRTVREICATGKVCLFIDGLDEFKGDHGDLVKYWNDLLAECPLKICFASRPWTVFEEAFMEQPSLMLQHLTYNDRKAYVSSHFEENIGFRRLQASEPLFSKDLILTVVESSEGVFLWVSLVVDSLLSGMRDADRVTDLQKRLDAVPRDLEDLFQRMLDDLSPKHLQHTAQYFQLIAACPQPPTAILLSFADEEEDDFAIKLPVQRYNWSEFNGRVEVMRVRVNSTCKGLLELRLPQRDDSATTYDKIAFQTVGYLHRTVKDFLEQPGPREKISKVIGLNFNAHHRLCSAHLALYKTCHLHFPTQRLSDTSCAALLGCLRQVSMVPITAATRMFPILENFREILRSRLETYHTIGTLLLQMLQSLETEAIPVPPSSLIPTDPNSTPSKQFASTVYFLSVAIYCQATPFVIDRVQSGFDDNTSTSTVALAQASSTKGRKRHSLATMLGGGRQRREKQLQRNRQPPSIEDWLLYNVIVASTTAGSIPLPLIELLLRKGARPDFAVQVGHGQPGQDTSIWQVTLAASIRASADNYSGHMLSEDWEKLIACMLAQNVVLNRNVVAGSLEVLKRHWNLEPREFDTKRMVDEVFHVLRMKRKGHDVLRSIGFTLKKSRT